MRAIRLAVLSLGIVGIVTGVVLDSNKAHAFGPGGGPVPTCPTKSCPAAR